MRDIQNSNLDVDTQSAQLSKVKNGDKEKMDSQNSLQGNNGALKELDFLRVETPKDLLSNIHSSNSDIDL